MKLIKKVFILLSLGLCLAFGIFLQISPYHGPLFSENRPTMDKPRMTLEGLGSGDYFNQVNDYIQDVNPWRQDLIQVKSVFQGKILRRPVVNNVYWRGPVQLPYLDGMDTDSLRPDLSAQDMAHFYKKLQGDCQKYGTQFLFVGIPNQTDIFSKKFPSYMEDTGYLAQGEKDLKEAMDQAGVDSLFLRDLLAQDPAAYYLKSDHHCSNRGLLLEAREILKKLASPYGQGDILEDFEEVKDPRPFVGSRSRKVPGLGPKENFAYYRYKKPWTYQLETPEGPGQVLELNPEKATVDYGIYMGGDQAYSVLKTDRPGGLRVLVYGDSYTNGLESTLAPYLSQMTSFDFRYGKKEDFFKELESGYYDYCLCIRDSGIYLKESPKGRFY